MARILLGDEWFEELASTSLYEREFERLLFQEAHRLFPEYHPVPFNMLVLSDEGAAKADFVLVHRNYRRWWVVEAEMGHHPLNAHVLPQVIRLSRAIYTEEAADYILQRAPSLHAAQVREMIKGEQPRVLVVANVPVPGWSERLQPYNAVVAIFQIFRSFHNHYIYRVNGDFPSENNEIITTCRCWDIHRFLKIDSPTQLPVKRGENITLYHESGAIEWERVDIADVALLHALRGHSLEKHLTYEIVKRNDGTFSIQVSKAKRKV